MVSDAAAHPTCCPKCQGAFDYRLDVGAAGGLRYEVSCTACGDVYYDLSALPVVTLPVAA